jgi:thiol:disulfide interchange protein DsbD
MFRKRFLISSFVALLGLAACSPLAGPASTGGSAPTAASPAKGGPVTSLNFVTARIAKVEIRAGGSNEATVIVEVQNGYHVNANPATDSYLKATEVVPQPGDGLTIGFVKYPTAITKKFSFSDKLLAVYEGDVPIKVMLQADQTATKGPHKVAAKLNVQACDDQVCYAPGTLELSIPVVVN